MNENNKPNDEVNNPLKSDVNIRLTPVKEKIYRGLKDISKIDWVDIPDTNKKIIPGNVITPVEIIEDGQDVESIDSLEELSPDEIIDESNYKSYLSNDSRDNWVGDKH